MTRVVHQIEALINELIEDVDARCLAGSEEPHHLYFSPRLLTKFVEDRCDCLAFLLRTGQRCVLRRIRDNEHTQWSPGQNRRFGQLRKGSAQLARQTVERAEEPFGIKIDALPAASAATISQWIRAVVASSARTIGTVCCSIISRISRGRRRRPSRFP